MVWNNSKGVDKLVQIIKNGEREDFNIPTICVRRFQRLLVMYVEFP